MLTNLLAKLLGRKPQPAPIVDVPKPKQKVNAKKAFATVRLKTGENVISKEFYGFIDYCAYSKAHLIVSGKDVLIKFFEREGSRDCFLQVTNDRLIRGTDILDIIGIVESDYEVEI